MSPKPCIDGIGAAVREDELDDVSFDDVILGVERLRAAGLRGDCVPEDEAAPFLAMLFSFFDVGDETNDSASVMKPPGHRIRQGATSIIEGVFCPYAPEVTKGLTADRCSL